MVKDVSVTIDGQEAAFRSTEGTVGELFTKEKLSLDKEDYLNVELDRKLYDGMDIIIRRAVPVKVAFDNKEIETKTASETVRELLDKLNIEYDGDDKVTPGLDEEITSNLGITVIKVEEKFEIHKEEIPYKTVTKNNSDLEKGKSKVLQDGKAGVKEIKTKLVYEDGVVTSIIVYRLSVITIFTSFIVIFRFRIIDISFIFFICSIFIYKIII